METENLSIEEIMLILSTIIYSPETIEIFNDADLENKIDNIYDLVQNIENTAEEPVFVEMGNGDWERLKKTIEDNKELFQDLKIYDYSDSDPFERNMTVVDSNGNVTVVYRGTAGGEWVDNGMGGYSSTILTPQQKAALDYFDKMIAELENKGYDISNIYTTGHSKGSNKAMMIAVLRDIVTESIAFDGQGFGPGFLNYYADQIAKNKDKITNIANANDFVNILFQSVAGNVIYVGTEDSIFGSDIAHNFMRQHSPFSILKENEDGTFSLGSEGKQNSLLAGLGLIINDLMWYMNEEDFQYFAMMLMTAMTEEKAKPYFTLPDMPEGFIDRFMDIIAEILKRYPAILDSIKLLLLILSTLTMTVNQPLGVASLILALATFTTVDIVLANNTNESFTDETRDFTDEMFENLMNIVEEVESEKWWDIGKWDIWYRIDDLFGGIKRDNENLNNYYKKLIDINEFSATEIRKIFNTINTESPVYGCKVENENSYMKQVNAKLKDIANRIKV